MKDILNLLPEKNILILGFGREGQSTLRFLRKNFPDKLITIADKNKISDMGDSVEKVVNLDKNLKIVTGEKYLKSLDEADFIFKTPGIPNKLAEIIKAKENGKIIYSQTKLFFDLARGEIIGVTGTKGKSTTASLINHILVSSGHKSILMGNIGKPPLDYLQEDKDVSYVFEMSSHQLSDLEKSPHIAVLLNFFREHLDYYENYDDYIKAKLNIAKYQDGQDCFICNFDDKVINKYITRFKSQILSFSTQEKKDSYAKNDAIYINDIKFIGRDEIPLKGDHNLKNVMAATLAARVLGIEMDQIKKAIGTFKPLQNRLDVIGTYKDITFVSDVLATIPEATIAAIEAYRDAVSTLICGGFDRGQDFSGLARAIINAKISCLILFPTTGIKIEKAVQNVNEDTAPKSFQVTTMDQAVKLAYENTPKNKVCLLSAASPSFSVFKNYEDEAEQYKTSIIKYSKI